MNLDSTHGRIMPIKFWSQTQLDETKHELEEECKNGLVKTLGEILILKGKTL